MALIVKIINGSEENIVEREKIKRNDLKKNFLKEIIMRLDFQGVLQAEMDKVLIRVKPYLKEKSFNKYEEKIANKIINNGEAATELKSQIVFSFLAESAGYTIDLSNTSIILTVSSQAYAPFEEYSLIFLKIASIYNEEIDFFTAKRFGLRKINFCFIRNREKINEYFDSHYYNCDVPLAGYESREVERIDRLSTEESNINLRYRVEDGELNEQQYYRVTLDSDVYVGKQEVIEKIIFDEDEMMRINEKLFEIYLNVLTDKFIMLLVDEEEPDLEILMGVEPNE